MEIFQTVEAFKDYTKAMKAAGKTIALVPTMGALHAGHIALMEAARKAADVVIASVFVNPTQFGPNEDYEAYPRAFSEDCEKLKQVPVDAVFHPEPAALYPEGYATYVAVEGDITNKLCGAQRPGHFRGVATVVTKLLHLARADKAFFGQKDAQQLIIIKKMTRDLNFDIEIIGCPIVREKDGLAMSSRNAYLNPEERKAATCLSKSIALGESIIKKGLPARELKDRMEKIIKGEPLAKMDYLEIVDLNTLQPVECINDSVLVAMAVHFGKTRLIDNFICEI